jgi:hypothetical protein
LGKVRPLALCPSFVSSFPAAAVAAPTGEIEKWLRRLQLLVLVLVLVLVNQQFLHGACVCVMRAVRMLTLLFSLFFYPPCTHQCFFPLG